MPCSSQPKKKAPSPCQLAKSKSNYEASDVSDSKMSEPSDGGGSNNEPVREPKKVHRLKPQKIEPYDAKAAGDMKDFLDIVPR